MKRGTFPSEGLERPDLCLGAFAPTTTWELSDGSTTSLLDYRGAPVVLSFFSSEWDPGQEHQIRIFNEALSSVSQSTHLLQLRTSGDAVYCEDSHGESERIPVFRGLDPDGKLGQEFGVQGQAAIFVIDPEGVIRYRHVGSLGSFPSPSSLSQLLETVRDHSVSRRQFVFTAAATLAALLLIPKIRAESAPWSTPTTKGATYTLHINGHSHSILADPRITVLDALRERLGMSGTKKGCDHGQCGACTIHVNGRRVNSCLLLAAQAEGSEITTIEGLAHGDQLHPVQEAFIEHDGFQCGYCTSGQIMSAVACIKEGHTKTKDEIQEWMSGNICRCGAYQGIFDAITQASGQKGAKA